MAGRLGAVPLASASRYAQLILSREPVGYWRLGEGSAVAVADSSATRADGRVAGKPAFARPGAVKQDADGAVIFDGSASYIEIPHRAVFSQPTSGKGLTVEAWLRPDVLQFPGESADAHTHWLGKGERNQFEWGLRFYSGGTSRPNRISAYLWNPEGGLGSGAYFEEPLKPGEWMHVVACFDPGDQSDAKAGVSIFKNGEFRGGRELSPARFIALITSPPRPAQRRCGSARATSNHSSSAPWMKWPSILACCARRRLCNTSARHAESVMSFDFAFVVQRMLIRRAGRALTATAETSARRCSRLFPTLRVPGRNVLGAERICVSSRRHGTQQRQRQREEAQRSPEKNGASAGHEIKEVVGGGKGRLSLPHAATMTGARMRAPASLLLALFLVLRSAGGAEAPVSAAEKITCEGKYPLHLQGIASDGEAIFWSWTNALAKTDMQGRLLAKVAADNHHGDPCVAHGKLFVAVNLGKFNESAGKADSWVYVYDANDLRLLARHAVPEVVHGAGGIAEHEGKFLVVGGLPADVPENFLYEYDENLRFVQRHVLASGYTKMGIQTATWANGSWWLGCYGTPQVVLRADAAFQPTGRWEFNASLGLEALPDGRLLLGRNSLEKGVGHTGWAIFARTDAERGILLAHP